MRPAVCRDFREADRISRREALEAGWLGALGLTLTGLWHGNSTASGSGAGLGKAKRCIFLFMWGGPSQLDTWDPKPDAPDEVRGEFKPIATSAPGIQICEHFPRLAGLAHEYAIVRSLTHDDPAHLSSAHHLLTGQYAPRRFSDADPPSPEDWPHLGSVVALLRPGSGRVPSFVTLPWICMHPAAPGGRAPGQNAGWLGSRFDPMSVGDPNEANFSVPGLRAPADCPTDRVDRRRGLLDQLEPGTLLPGVATWRTLSERAFDLLSGAGAQQAFDLSREPDGVRDRYGRNTHGQSVLLARRLVEAGVPLVTVNWHNDNQNFWDTHGDNFNQLKNRLMPASDRAFSALLEDLRARGLLEETLVVWVGEFGRKPHITRNNAGREHWPRCFSAVLAGGGIAGGRVIGASDRFAAFPAVRPLSPSDLAATVLYALGVAPDTVIEGRFQVPRRVASGAPITELFG